MLSLIAKVKTAKYDLMEAQKEVLEIETKELKSECLYES